MDVFYVSSICCIKLRQSREDIAEGRKGVFKQNHTKVTTVVFTFFSFGYDFKLIPWLCYNFWFLCEYKREEKLRDFGVACGPWKVSSMFFKLQSPVWNASVSLVCSGEPWHKLTVLDQQSVRRSATVTQEYKPGTAFIGMLCCSRVKEDRKDQLSMRRELC